MDRPEFTRAMLYLSAGCQKMLKPEEVSVYFDLLQDLDYEDFLIGVKRVLLAHVWATFPSVAELRQAVTEVANWRKPRLASGEAWALASEAAAKIDLDVRGPFVRNGKTYESQAACVLESLPPQVVRAMKTFGLREFCYAKDPVGVVRAQFTQIYEQIAERENRAALLPPSIREHLETKRDETMLHDALNSIGKELSDGTNKNR